MQVDPVELEVIANRLDEIQRIMKHRMFHTGYSVILRESFDGTAGLTDPEGRVIGAPGFVTHAGSYRQFIRAVLERYGPDRIFDGDTFITNDPYLGGPAHTPDVAVATPVFAGTRLIGFCTSMGHKPDVGGIAPGTSSPASRSIYHEGLLIPPVKLYERLVPNESVEHILQRNSRTPDLLMGDIRGQVGCTRIGAELLKSLCEKSGAYVLEAAISLLIDMAKRRIGDLLAGIRDGEAEAEKLLDSDPVTGQPASVRVAVRKAGRTLTVDFTGTAAQSAGPINAVPQVVRAAAVGAVLAFIDHTIPNNEGAAEAIDVVLPRGSIVHPLMPAPVNSYIPTTHLAFNAVIEALGRLYPDRAVGESGLGLGAMTLGYKDQGSGATYVHYEIAPTALGGTSHGDGASIINPMPLYETIQPIEIVETEFPVRITKFAVRTDSAGAGEHRGGIGCIREFEVLAECQMISRLSQRRFGSVGAAGGKAPVVSRTLYRADTNAPERALKGLDNVDMPAGSSVRIENSGGAGWGDPHRRPVEKVLDDVADGYVSIEAAARDYGLVVKRDAHGRCELTENCRRADAAA